MTVHEAFLEQDILDLQNKIEQLEKENAELNNFIMQSKKDGISPINALIIKNLGNQLTKAKEIIRELLCLFPDFQAKSLGDLHILNTLAKAEAFLNSEVEK